MTGLRRVCYRMGVSTKTKPKVGDVMWRVYSSRRHPREEAVTVTKVGRKYFTVANISHPVPLETEHEMGGGYERGDHRGAFRVYASQREHLDEVEVFTLQNKLEQYFRRYRWGLSLEQMRQIAAIVDDATEGTP